VPGGVPVGRVKALAKAWGITEGRAADCLADRGRAPVAWEPCSCPVAQTLHPEEAVSGYFAASCQEQGAGRCGTTRRTSPALSASQ
jgi:hypothetical protein